jgi:A/G-specific adenine glycosylase
MKGYALQVAVRDEEAFKRLGFFAAAFSQVKEQYSLPSAFGAYVKNLKELRTGR